MTKPIIAIDVDEVLSNTVADFMAYSNQHFGTKLTVDDYDEHWGRMWQIDEAEAERRAVAWRGSGMIAKHQPNVGAKDILRHLSSGYDLVVTTSRRQTMSDETTTWLHQHFGDVFKDIFYTGIYDQAINDVSFEVTKGELYKRIGADYAIDDQLKHCLAADDVGVSAILFGNYPWNQHDSLPLGITRCANWLEVGAYFDGRA